MSRLPLLCVAPAKIIPMRGQEEIVENYHSQDDVENHPHEGSGDERGNRQRTNPNRKSSP